MLYFLKIIFILRFLLSWQARWKTPSNIPPPPENETEGPSEIQWAWKFKLFNAARRLSVWSRLLYELFFELTDALEHLPEDLTHR